MSYRKSLLLAVALSLTAAEALAQARPLSTRMSCRQAAGLVHARGALVLGTGVHTYDRFVRDRSFCEITEIYRARLRADARSSAMLRRLHLQGADRIAAAAGLTLQASPAMATIFPVPPQAGQGAPA